MEMDERISMKEEDKRKVAELIAVKVGAVNKCKLHLDVFLDQGDPESLQQAYNLGDTLFRNKDAMVTGFESIEELREAIKGVLEDAAGECYCCRKFDYE